jgi:transcriptional regulator EpsA
MHDYPKLTDGERDYLSDIVESSLRVMNRHQFFVWSQGALQRLVPHEILICGLDGGPRNGFEQHHFEATRYFRETHFQALCRTDTGLLAHLSRISKRTGDLVVLAPHPSTQSDPLDRELIALIGENELKNLAACLWMGPRSGLEAYYSFSRVNPLSERTGYLLEMVVPYVHATFLRVLSNEHVTLLRVLANEQSGGAARSRPGRLVTARQQEILALIRDGKTNSEIADILELSPWTIKNHIQMIFQRLNTTNRTQTISRAISLGIL